MLLKLSISYNCLVNTVEDHLPVTTLYVEFNSPNTPICMRPLMSFPYLYQNSGVHVTYCT